MRRVSFIGFLFGLTILVAALMPLTGNADEVSFFRGQKLSHMLSVCLDKADALAILEADEKDGKDAATAIWMAKARCSSVPVQGPLVGKVVKAVKVKRGDKTITARVVEIVNDGQVIGYFFTTSTVDERDS